MLPLVTIITASFNSEKTIQDAIESVLKQTYSNIEYIIIDGNSNDDTIKIIKEYELKFNGRLKWISEPDKGYADAWNKGIRLAKGDVIALLNSDDYYELNAVENALKCIDIGKPLLTYGICKFIDDEKYVIKTNDIIFEEHDIYRGFGFMHTTCFATKKMYDEIGLFDIDVNLVADTDFLIRCYLSKIPFIRTSVITYMRLGGISDKYELKAYKNYCRRLSHFGFDKRKILNNRLKFLGIYGIKKILKIRLVKQFLIQLYHLSVWGFNIAYNWIPFFFLKRLILKLYRIKIGRKTYIHPNVKFFFFGNLQIGNNTVINNGCYLDNRRKITIGNNVSISHDTKIYTYGHDIQDPYFKHQGKEVIIEDYVVIFTNVLIMPGVTIHKGAVVYAGSVIVKDVQEYTIVGGNPAKEIGKRNCELKYTLDHGYWKAL